MRKKLSSIVLAVAYCALVPVAGYAEPAYVTEKVLVRSNKAKFIEVVSQATLVGKTKGRYSVKNLFDDNTATAWVTRHDPDAKHSDNGLLKFIFDRPVFIKSISIRNGYQKSLKLFEANQSIKDLSIEKVLIGGRSFPLENIVRLSDAMGIQEISLIHGWTDAVNLFRVKELIFNVQDVYPGEKYQDLCISGVTIHYSNETTYSPHISWGKLRKLIDNNATHSKKGWDWSRLSSNDSGLFTDFLYYTLSGNKEAYSYFRNYLPEGAGQEEAMDRIYRRAVRETFRINGVNPRSPRRAQ